MASLIKRLLPFLMGLGLVTSCRAGWLNPTQQGFVIQTFTSYQPISGNNSGVIVTNGNSYQFAGDNTGYLYIGGPGSQFRGVNDGSLVVNGAGSFVLGSFGSLAMVTNLGKGSLLLGNLSAGQKAVITDVGNASILLGAGVVSNSQAIVVGDGNESHGLRSVTADSFWGMGSGFHGDGSSLVGITAAQVGAAESSHTQAASTITGLGTAATNATSDFATAVQGAKADAALTNDLYYTPESQFTVYNNNGIVQLQTYSGTDAFVRVPPMIGGKAIKEIAEDCFRTKPALRRLEIPAGITNLQRTSIFNSTNLSIVSLPEGLLRIGNQAFQSAAITDIVIPKSVASIGQLAFYQCALLSNVWFEGDAPVMGATPFDRCAATLRIHVTPQARGFTTGTWQDFPIVIPVVGVVIGNTTNVADADGNVNLSVLAALTNTATWYTRESAFGFDGAGSITGYSGTNTELRIPPSIGGVPVTAIGNFAFQGRTNIVRLVLPESVKTVGAYTFSGCYELTAADMPGAISIGHSAFRDCYRLASISVPKVVYIEDNAFISCFGLTAVSLPSVQTIGSGAYSFFNCTNLVSVSVPVVTWISPMSFLGCTKLASVYFSGNAPTLGTYVDPFTSQTMCGVFSNTAPAIAYFPRGRTGYDTWGYSRTSTWVQADNIYSLAVNGIGPDVSGNISLGAGWKTNVWWAYASSNATEKTAFTNIYLGR